MAKYKRTAEDWAVDMFVCFFACAYGALTLVPFMNIISKAFSSEWALIPGKVGVFPVGFQLDTLAYVIQTRLFLTSFGNSVLVVVAGTGLMALVTGLAAYPLSKPGLPLRRPLLVAFVFSMLFNAGMIPMYLLMKQLSLTNTLWVLFLPGAINVYNLLLIKNFYESLPDSLEESARIDGASNIVILFRIVVPLALPVFATVSLFTAVGLWNDYFSPMLYNTQSAVKTLPLYLRDIITEKMDDITALKTSDDMMNLLPEGIRAASIVASTVPILAVYPFVQKYFIKGVLIGSVKG